MGLASEEMNQVGQAVILCGGLGSRLYPYTKNMPKPMAPCNGKPFLWHLLQQLYELKISRFLLLTGYLSKEIEMYFSDGSSWGWSIEYSKGPVEWDTGKRIWEAKEKIDDMFLLLYSDNFAPFPLDKVLQLHKNNQKSLTFMVAPKKPGNIKLSETGIVQKYNNNRSCKGFDYVEIGYMIVEKRQTLAFYDVPECSFSSILRKMAAKHQISAWIQRDTYYSISDPIRWKKAEKYLDAKKIILIDRDGVINNKALQGEYISRWEDFEWIEETRNAMKNLAMEGFQFIIISNQAGLSRGMVEQAELERIHHNMKDDLKSDGVEILDIYICPHHWEDKCFCRKPNPGMFFQASKDYLFRLDKTLFIGDDPRDCQAAKKAGCSSIFIGNEAELRHLKNEEKPIYSSTSMLSSVGIIIEYFSSLENSNNT
jgi:histidinol-phosphate phosphatase family protein